MQAHAGYVTDIHYPCHFHRQLQPLWLETTLILLGLKAPVLDAHYRYGELGCATGINLLVSAVCHPQAHFVGVDFNAAHIDFARRAASALKLNNIEFIHADFASFAEQKPKPFDVLVCHGVWSWIDANAQAAITRLLRQALKDQGVFYLHYMSHPGATALQPLQRLLKSFAEQIQGNAWQKMQGALDQVLQLANAGAFADQPHMLKRLSALAEMDASYLAHDFLSDTFNVLHSVDVHQAIAAHGLSYLACADVLENLDSLSIPRALQPMIHNAATPVLREQLRDLARHQHQRQDLFQRTPKVLEPQARIHALRALRFALVRVPPARINTGIGPIEPPATMLKALIAHLGQGPLSMAELIEKPGLASSHNLLLECLQLLMSQGYVHPCLPGQASNTDAINTFFKRQQIDLTVLGLCATAYSGAAHNRKEPC